MSYAVFNKHKGYVDLGATQQPNASAAVVNDLVTKLVANANSIIAPGLISQGRLQFFPSGLQSQAATQPVQVFIKMVTSTSGGIMAEVITEANAMSGVLSRVVPGTARSIPMGVVQPMDATMDPVIKSVVVPLRLTVQWTVLRLQDPALLMAALGKVLVRQGLWPIQRLQSWLATLPSPTAAINLLKSQAAQGIAALNPAALVQNVITAGKNLVQALTHIPGLSGVPMARRRSGMGDGDDIGEVPQEFGTDPGSPPSADPNVGPPIPDQPTGAMPADSASGEAPANEAAGAAAPAKDANKGTKGTAGAVPQIIGLINQLLKAGNLAGKSATQAQSFVDQILGRNKKSGGKPPAPGSIIPGVPDIALFGGAAVAAFIFLKK